jgi:hypothetical protein
LNGLNRSTIGRVLSIFVVLSSGSGSVWLWQCVAMRGNVTVRASPQQHIISSYIKNAFFFCH